MPGGDDSGLSSAHSLPIIHRRSRVSKRRMARPRVEEERSVPSEPITVKSNKDAPHPMALRLEEVVEFIPEKGLLVGKPIQIEVGMVVSPPPSESRRSTFERRAIHG